MKRTATLFTILALTSIASANKGDREEATPTEEVDNEQIVLLNASSQLQDMGGIDRISK